jgi:predicted dehydrogenase
MPNERVIVAGAGSISNAWFPHLKTEELNIVAVVDVRPESAERQVAKYELKNTRVHADLDTALRECPADFLLDLTIPDAHHDVTIKALRAGLHVIGEKPMASTMDQAREMVKVSEQTGRLYMVSQSRRWDAKHDAICRTLSAGTIGQLATLNCDFFLAAHFGGFRDEMPSPLILDMAIHHFDLARHFSGRNAVSVYAEEFNPAGSWYKGDVAANCLFEMEDGLRFAYRGSWCSEGMHTGWNGNWRLIGTAGTLIYEGDQTITGEIVAGDTGFIRPKAPATIAESPMTHFTMHGALREMLEFLRTGRKPQTECHDNNHSLAMVFAAIKSAREGRRVSLSEV